MPPAVATSTPRSGGSRPIAAPRRSSPCCSLLAAAVRARLHRALRRRRHQHAAARAGARRRAGAAGGGADRRRQVRRPPGDARSRSAARCSSRRRREEVVELIEAGGEGISRRALLAGAGGVAGAARRDRGRGSRRLARSDARTTSTARRGSAGVRLVDDQGRPYLRQRDPDRRLLHRAARARRPRALRRGAARRAAPARADPAARRRAQAGRREGILAYSKICPHAGCAISLYRYPTYQPTSDGPGVHVPVPLLDVLPGRGRPAAVRPGRPRTAAAAADDRRRRATCAPPARSTRTSVRRGGTCTGASREAVERIVHRRFVRTMRSSEQRVGAARGIKWLLRYVFPDHWSFLLGEIALYSFMVLVGTGIFLTLYYVPGDAQVIYHGSYSLLAGEQMSEAYRSVLDLSFSVPAGLLFRQVHHWAADVFIGRDRPAPDADLLHRRLPQAARPQLLHRPDDADAGDPRGIRRLLAGRRPAVRDGAGDRLLGGDVDPADRRPVRLPGVGRPVPGLDQLPAPPRDHPRAPHPGRADRADHRAPGRSSCASTTRSSPVPAGASATSSGRRCGPPTRCARSGCCSPSRRSCSWSAG